MRSLLIGTALMLCTTLAGAAESPGTRGTELAKAMSRLSCMIGTWDSAERCSSCAEVHQGQSNWFWSAGGTVLSWDSAGRSGSRFGTISFDEAQGCYWLHEYTDKGGRPTAYRGTFEGSEILFKQVGGQSVIKFGPFAQDEARVMWFNRDQDETACVVATYTRPTAGRAGITGVMDSRQQGDTTAPRGVRAAGANRRMDSRQQGDTTAPRGVRAAGAAPTARESRFHKASPVPTQDMTAAPHPAATAIGLAHWQSEARWTRRTPWPARLIDWAE